MIVLRIKIFSIFAAEIAIAGVSGLIRAEIIPIDLIRIMPA
jgi:hypothetical protein